jgi:hypothetical protein
VTRSSEVGAALKTEVPSYHGWASRVYARRGICQRRRCHVSDERLGITGICDYEEGGAYTKTGGRGNRGQGGSKTKIQNKKENKRNFFMSLAARVKDGKDSQ